MKTKKVLDAEIQEILKLTRYLRQREKILKRKFKDSFLYWGSSRLRFDKYCAVELYHFVAKRSYRLAWKLEKIYNFIYYRDQK